MATIHNSRRLGAAMMAAGLVPSECYEVEVTIPATGIPQVRYTVHLTGERMLLFARVFTAVVESSEERPNE